MLDIVRYKISLLPALLLLTLTGCTRSGGLPAVEARAAAQAEQARQMNELREDIDHIPPPSKTRYMAVKSLEQWENPYLTVQGDMVTLHVVMADANKSDMGQGGLLRPLGARRQDLNVRMDDLPAALNAVPQTAWPYGRVIAIEEAHQTPAGARPQVRRNMEVAIKTLSDLGVVVYEWQEGGIGGLR
ncbi:hypothetical protein FTO74_14675 [Granulicella sp. WH15]|nr:hypothetical protein FTO74_14675 [Granulicella sp. WH15]